MKTDAELFAERIYFTPEERRAFLRGVEWAVIDNDPVQSRDRLDDYKKKCYIHEMFEKPYGY